MWVPIDATGRCRQWVAAGPVMFIVLGSAGLVGLANGDMVDKWGLSSVLFVIVLLIDVSLVIVGMTPDHAASALGSAALHGA